MLAGIKKGDELAFKQLYERHSTKLLTIAYSKTKSIEIAEEIVQDTFLTFYNKKEAVDNNPLLYLKAVLKFKILEHIKTQYKTKTHPLDSDYLVATRSMEVPEKLEIQETQSAIYKKIQSLPQQCREVFVLRRDYNFSNEEVANKLGISVKTVEAHMTKALAALKKNLEHTLIIFLFLLS
ncbi:sigma-70 family RNA polymerase sigma factor [Niabella sp. CC-SYL272]|uniref:RNA polymerase sigma factor n=1 Tax=Niabella agricola TaxID=2891571 RepID=UPI001F2F1ACC|nr:sigma-70 family RNA polymerase sigma factor [Niabella agricola]MCF3109621.1 sigma-70 family RNA polymerase sigma factor [Niabella agricola]